MKCHFKWCIKHSFSVMLLAVVRVIYQFDFDTFCWSSVIIRLLFSSFFFFVAPLRESTLAKQKKKSKISQFEWAHSVRQYAYLTLHMSNSCLFSCWFLMLKTCSHRIHTLWASTLHQKHHLNWAQDEMRQMNNIVRNGQTIYECHR